MTKGKHGKNRRRPVRPLFDKIMGDLEKAHRPAYPEDPFFRFLVSNRGWSAEVLRREHIQRERLLAKRRKNRMPEWVKIMAEYKTLSQSELLQKMQTARQEVMDSYQRMADAGIRLVNMVRTIEQPTPEFSREIRSYVLAHLLHAQASQHEVTAGMFYDIRRHKKIDPKFIRKCYAELRKYATQIDFIRAGLLSPETFDKRTWRSFYLLKSSTNHPGKPPSAA